MANAIFEVHDKIIFSYDGETNFIGQITEILVAQGFKEKEILDAEGKAKAIRTLAQANAERIKVTNQSVARYFTKAPQKYKQLQVFQKALENNSKIIVAKNGSDLLNVIGDTGNILPIRKKKEST